MRLTRQRSLPRAAGRAALAACILALLVLAAGSGGADERIDLLALGDWGIDSPAQKAVAAGMKSYVERNGLALDAVLLLGDNFYVDLDGGVEDRHWKQLFERRYDPKCLAAPFYAVLGNHDHSGDKARTQIEYSKRNPESRFKLPAHWYRVDLRRSRPLVTLIALDSNPGALGEERWAEQTRWLENELSRPERAPWTICFAHHPLFSDSAHGDDAKLQAVWGPIFEQHDVDFYLAGHDHALEHLQIPDRATSFIVSGGGGYDTYEIERDRAIFARGSHGFVHLQITPERARVIFLDERGRTLHAFERALAGKVTAVEGSARGR